ncbi:MAG: hypothetical protein HFJ29_05120 [Clostridia bacterium]|nr:hypothetical protein [Clostridia bacterium]
MEDLKNEKDSIKKIYGNENLKEILTNLLEKTFIEKIENIEKLKKK